MEYHECLAAIKRRFWLILAVMAVASATAWAVSRYLITSVYKSTATIIAGAANSAGADGKDVLLDSNVVMVYYNLAESASVVDGVIRRLDLKSPEEKVREQIGIEADYETGIMRITVKAGTAELARGMALAFIDSLGEESGKLNLTAQIRTIDAPTAPARPSSPNTPLNVLLAAAGGFFAGMLLALFFGVREQTADDIPVLQKAPGLNLLGALPRISSRVLRKDPLLLCPEGSASREAIKAVQANLLNLMEMKDIKTVLVTSPRASEGKTTFAVNLAASMAGLGKRVLLVECNYKKPALFRLYSMKKYVRLPPPAGDVAKLDTIAYSIPSLGIDLISDTLPQQGCRDHTGAALLQPFSGDILQAYDLIVLDSPPMLPCADALLLGRLVQGVVLVADYRRLSAAVLEKCVARLAQAGAKFLGVVINNLPAAKILQ